ncbi:hypothetical protein JMN32_17645 [Fulvivirga sp. 29W222]|uniref:Malectin domain-containing protein n=1 Tax=Fulvivirga marina TaxID=2494733 RepID=A0A937G012_9BACT|nr:malectin domain-containing carbohydrate-binding protein [Fulvivirga marina]MBL6448147.1 hypothetical protein [Fulvivirga marina]
MKPTITYLPKWLLCLFLILTGSGITVNAQNVAPKTDLKKVLASSLDNIVDERPQQVQMLSGAPLYQINAGGWEAPDSWEEDSWAHPSPYVGPVSYRSANGIDGQFYLKKSRVSYSNMEWDFPVASGNYIVTLHFAESPNTSQVIGSRVFDVNIEGRKALDDFDILNYVGKGASCWFYYSLAVTDGNLDIDFLVEEGSALISAIEISPGMLDTQDPILSQSSRALVKTVAEGTELRIPIRAIDFDSPSDTIHIFGGDTGEPIGFETVIDYGNGYGEMILRPGYDDAGSYLLFIASEDEDGLETACNACWALVELTVTDTPEGQAIYRVNAGGWAPVDDIPIPWAEDSYLNPSPYIIKNYVTQAHSVTSNTTEAPIDIFDRSRVAWNSNMLWNFPVANGNYKVDLFFTESYFNFSGGRVFDILIENQVAFDDFDIFSEVGRNAPLQKTTSSQVNDGNLTVQLKRELANPMIAGISITYNGEHPSSTFAPEMLSFTDANEQLMMTVSAYPNPIETSMVLSFSKNVKGVVSLRFIDKNNQVRYQAVDKSDVSRTKATFSIDPGLPAGIYLAEVSVGSYKQYVKIMKK